MNQGLAVLLLAFVAAGCASTPPLPANVTIAPDPIDFGKVYVGDQKAMNAVLTNGTTKPIQVRSSSMGPGAVFALGANPPALPAPLANGASLTFPLRFTPPSTGTHNGTWHVTIDRRPYAQSLTGEGVLFWFDDTSFVTGGNASAGSGLDFGDVLVGESKELEVEMRNAILNGPAIVFPAAPVVAPAGPFTIRRPAGPATINAPPARSKVDVKVVFTPVAAGRFTATVTWTDNAGAVRLKVLASGNGISPE